MPPPVLRRCVLLLGALLLALGLSVPAYGADEPSPSFPSGLPSPGDIGNPVDGGFPQGPTFVITPSSTGTALPDPVPSGGTPPTGLPASPGATGTAGATTTDGGLVVPENPTATTDTAGPSGTGGWILPAALVVIAVMVVAGLLQIVAGRVTRTDASR